jgi:hypothetical protein
VGRRSSCEDSGVPDLGGLDLLGEWRKVMNSLLTSATGGRADLPRALLEPMQRQLELVQEVLERERALQRQLTSRLLAPADALFNLLEESGSMLRRQAEALESAGLALSETAGLMKSQAELFERTIGVLREPTELVKVAAGLERKPRRTRKPKSD